MDPIYESYKQSNEEQVDEMLVSKRARYELANNIYNYLRSFNIDESHIAAQQIGTAITMAFNEAFDLAPNDRKEAFKKFVAKGLDAQHF